MKRKSLILLSLVLILALAFAGTALAQKAKKPYDLVQWNKPKPIARGSPAPSTSFRRLERSGEGRHQDQGVELRRSGA